MRGPKTDPFQQTDFNLRGIKHIMDTESSILTESLENDESILN
jgi:hypothetical protein